MSKYKISLTLIVLMLIGSATAWAQQDGYNHNKFKQLKEELATPNVYRTAAGAPGHEYYQQKADYVMNITLDDENQENLRRGYGYLYQ